MKKLILVLSLFCFSTSSFSHAMESAGKRKRSKNSSENTTQSLEASPKPPKRMRSKGPEEDKKGISNSSSPTMDTQDTDFSDKKTSNSSSSSNSNSNSNSNSSNSSSSTSTASSFEERLEQFKKGLTWQAKSHLYPQGLWSKKLDFQVSGNRTVPLLLQVFEEPYKSSIALETEMKRLIGSEQDLKYYWITLSQEKKGFDPSEILKIRVDHLGILGELVHLSKADGISGSQVLTYWTSLRDQLRPKVFLTHDESQFTLTLNSNAGPKHREFLMRGYYPLSSKNGGAWYEENAGFRVLSFESIYHTATKYYGCHNADIYYAAVKKLRALPLSELSDLFLSFKPWARRQENLATLVKTYFASELSGTSGDPWEKVRELKLTLHDLVFRIVEALKGNSAPMGRSPSEITSDFDVLYGSLLNPPPQKKGFDPLPIPLRNYFLATGAMASHAIYVHYRADTTFRLTGTSSLVSQAPPAAGTSSSSASMSDEDDNDASATAGASGLGLAPSTAVESKLERVGSAQAGDFDQMVLGLDPYLYKWEHAGPLLLGLKTKK